MGILRRFREWREDKNGVLTGPDIDADSVNTEHISSSDGTVEIGDDNTQADEVNSKPNVALGANAKATHDDCVVIGEDSQTTDPDQVFVGRGTGSIENETGASATDAESGVALGDDALVGKQAFACGTLARADTKSVVIGHDNDATGQGNVTAVGSGISFAGTFINSTVIGKGASIDGNAITAIGQGVDADDESVVIGASASGDGIRATVVGEEATADQNGVSVGNSTEVNAQAGIAIGYNTSVSVQDGARIAGQIVSQAPDGSRFADADLNTNELTAYLDEANSNLEFKIKNSSGTVKTGTVSVS